MDGKLDSSLNSAKSLSLLLSQFGYGVMVASVCSFDCLEIFGAKQAPCGGSQPTSPIQKREHELFLGRFSIPAASRQLIIVIIPEQASPTSIN